MINTAALLKREVVTPPPSLRPFAITLQRRPGVIERPDGSLMNLPSPKITQATPVRRSVWHRLARLIKK
ncbi:hypothetical protein Q4519_06940 [Motilimonas sp. 1_MG-2023]|uniref:hypothetical protein n=1 Tax=Motilimonas sp. 1_MG-2023 TaxID=3062672 RepID=UPI0026E12B39|nr:hypothetical protein [Motilimonas sp. 1_MG-2023]MDO6525417.1 hypothetical protein [Motilimonas sp. 1_MG-2023]